MHAEARRRNNHAGKRTVPDGPTMIAVTGRVLVSLGSRMRRVLKTSYVWAIPIRERQRRYHAEHGNGLTSVRVKVAGINATAHDAPTRCAAQTLCICRPIGGHLSSSSARAMTAAREGSARLAFAARACTHIMCAPPPSSACRRRLASSRRRCVSPPPRVIST